MTMMLADLGAEVIKIEHPVRGDDTRSWAPPYVEGLEDQGMSSYFMCLNRNKKSLALDLQQPRGLAIARKLITDSKTNLLVENFKVGGMAKFGLDYPSVSQENPALVYCSITGFGQTGPYRDRPGYDLAIQGQSGLMSITGTPDQEPQKVGVAISDIIAGLYAGNGVQAALRQAEKTGVGQHVDIALLDTQIAALVNIASNYLTTKVTPQRIGNTNPTIVPYQSFGGSDGKFFIIACGNDGQFSRLANLLAKSEWSNDDRFSTNPGRVRNRDKIVALLGAEFKKQPANHWVTALLDVGVPAAPINDVGTSLDDEHVRARGMVQEVVFQSGQQEIFTEMVASPLKLSKVSMDDFSPPPFVGEHSDEILRDILGFDDKAIAELRDEKIIR